MGYGLPKRLRNAAKFGFLSAHVKVTRAGDVFWRHPQPTDSELPLFYVEREPTANGWFFVELPTRLVNGGGKREGLILPSHRQRQDAIRAGLLALADELEATL